MDASQEVPPDPAMENELTEEDLFRMKGLSIGGGSASLVTSETAEQSIISLADSSSNFDEHVGDEFDEVETVDDGDDIDSQSRIFNGWLFARKRQDNAVLNMETVTILQFPRDLPIPACPPTDTQEEWEKAFRQATVYLIGTAHFSKESQEDVVNTIRVAQPDMVMVELCPSRISILSMDEETLLREASELNTQKIMNTIKTSGTVLGVLHVLLLSMSAHITRQLSMAPGGEFRAAHKAVMQTQMCRLVLGDRPIQITLQRALGSLTFWQKIKFMCHVAVSHFTPITPEDIEKCKKRDLLEELLAEMAGDFPKLTKIFVDERDAYMTHALHTLLLRNTVEKRTTWLRNRQEAEWQPINVVSVVGIGHTPGIIANWNTPVDITPLIELPPPSVSGMIIRYSFKLAFYGAVGFLIYKGGSRIARRFVKPEMAVLNELWTIDCNALFQNYNNFSLWRKADAGSFGALLYGRPSKKMIVQVFFVDVESLNAGNVEFLTSAVSPDLEMVGNLAIEGFDVPLLSSGFTLTTTKEILDNADIHGFFDHNGMLNATQMTNEGLSLWTKIGFECNVRTGKETTDLRSSAERYLDNIERILFINQDKGIILRPTDEKSVVQKILDEHAKGASQYKDSLEFQAVHSLTRNTKNDSDDQKMVPLVRITRDGTSYMNVSCVVLVVVPAFLGDDSKVIYERFREGVRRRIQNMVYVSINGLKKQKELLPTTSYVFMPPNWSSFLHLQLPNWPDAELKAYRQRLHKLFNLTPSSPCLRTAQQIAFGGGASCKLLRSPHLSISNYKPKGVINTVKGPYNYHHYMQDNFDDSGWGCAYRSFQTIWSWFVLNGYTDKPVPNHREIQQCLVNIGDKEEKFIGSRQWIGSTEIGFVLETLLGIESKFIITNSGGEVPERTRELARHFETAGSPVMIGGAQLAHTILGVDFDENSGECSFLILDPHYTGSEDLRAVLSKGWCAWKPASFWKPEHFYNMVLPQPPVDAI